MIALQKPQTIGPVILRHTRVLRAETSAAWKAVSCDVAKRVECGGSPPLSKACAANWHFDANSMQACASHSKRSRASKSGPKSRGSNRNQTATDRKKFVTGRCGAASAPAPSYILHSRPSFCTLRQPLPAFANHCQPPPPPSFFTTWQSLMVVVTQSPVTVSHGQSRSVAPGRAWSRPFRKKKIVYFFMKPSQNFVPLRQCYSAPERAWFFSGTWMLPRKLSGLELLSWWPPTRTFQQ